VKKVKIIESIKLHFVQQYFKASDMVFHMENPEPDMPYYNFEDEDNGDKRPDEEAEDEVQEKPAEEEEAQQDGEEVEPVEEREPEEHEEYIPPDEDEPEKESSHNFEPYDPNDILEIEVKVSTKVKGLKKMILEKVDLYKKANIILLKKSE
jgi:hypothetical protein